MKNQIQKHNQKLKKIKKYNLISNKVINIKY